MTNLPFSRLDSWAVWDVPNVDNLINKTAVKKASLFKDAYKPNKFPSDEFETDSITLKKRLVTSKYVIVGLNQGNAAAKEHLEPFWNFHGNLNSPTYRLASVIYGTALWGSFITDLDPTIDSNSQNVHPGPDQVKALEQHLDDLGVPEDAVLVGLGKSAYNTLLASAKRSVFGIYHYANRKEAGGVDAMNEQVQGILNGKQIAFK